MLKLEDFFFFFFKLPALTPKHGLRYSRNLEKAWKSLTSLGAWCLWRSPKAWWTSQDRTAASSTALFRWEEGASPFYNNLLNAVLSAPKLWSSPGVFCGTTSGSAFLISEKKKNMKQKTFGSLSNRCFGSWTFSGEVWGISQVTFVSVTPAFSAL